MARAATTERREAILDAATRLFASAGSRGTSIASIAELAGLTDAGVLYHFRTKNDLLIAVLERFDASVQQVIDASGHTGVALLRSVREWGSAMESIPAIQAMQVTLSAEQIDGEGAARDYFVERYQRLLERYAQAFAEAAANGDLHADLDPLQEASALLAHLDGIRLQWFFLGDRVSMARSVAAYVDATIERLQPGGDR